MNKNERYEEEVNIFNLILFVISKWKSILALAIICLVLGAGYGAVTGMAAAPTPEVESGVTEEAEESHVSEAAEQIYQTAEQRIKELERYLDEAKIMDINAYDLYKGTLTYVVEGTNKDLTGANVAIYSHVWDGALLQDLVEAGPYTAVELNNLLGMTQGEVKDVALDEAAIESVTERIGITAATEKEAEKLMLCMQESISDYLDGLQQEGRIAGYRLVSAQVMEASSTALADYQNQIRERYTKEKTDLATYKSDMEAAAAADAAAEEVAETCIDKSRTLKFGILGLAGGIVIGVILWGLMYLLGGRLYGISDKERRFGVKQIGSIHDFEKKKCIDLWLARKLGGVYSKLPLSEQRDVVALNVKNELEKEASVKKVFLVSSQGPEMNEAARLKASLVMEGYEVAGCENVIGRADVLQRVAQCDAALIIEDNARSKASIVEEEISILREYVKNVVGMVVVEGGK